MKGIGICELLKKMKIYAETNHILYKKGMKNIVRLDNNLKNVCKNNISILTKVGKGDYYSGNYYFKLTDNWFVPFLISAYHYNGIMKHNKLLHQDFSEYFFHPSRILKKIEQHGSIDKFNDLYGFS
jgi:hypothetical protein